MASSNLEQAIVQTVLNSGGKALRSWVSENRPGARRLLRGALAGVGASALVALIRKVRGDQVSAMDLLDAVAIGAAKGVIYTAVVDPLLPGPPVVRGALLAAGEHVAAPWGGVLPNLVSMSPLRRLPLAEELLRAGDDESDPALQHLIYSIALAVLTGDAED
jgi:hypothetical protein